MATETKKQGAFAKFMHWYESYQGKNIVNIVYSVGASVVIIGALFKILHWPGASQVLMVGMFTEAFLFIIGALDRPHPEFHWDNVFPQLLGYGTNPELLEEKANQPRPTLVGAGVEGSSAASMIAGNAGGAAVPSVGALSESDMASLKAGLADLAKSAGQLTELSKVAAAGEKLGEKFESASQAVEKIAGAADKLEQDAAQLGTAYAATGDKVQQMGQQIQTAADSMAKVGTHIEAIAANTETVGQKAGQLASIYEQQIVAAQAQVEAQKAQNESISKTTASLETMLANTQEAQKNQEAYTAASRKLAEQVAQLNQVYGNMLTALA